MTRRDLCMTLARPHLPLTPLTLSKPAYQEEKRNIATTGTSSHAQPLLAPPRYSPRQKCGLQAVATSPFSVVCAPNVNTDTLRCYSLSHCFYEIRNFLHLSSVIYIYYVLYIYIYLYIYKWTYMCVCVYMIEHNCGTSGAISTKLCTHIAICIYVKMDVCVCVFFLYDRA
jgi:hypothetical protein